MAKMRKVYQVISYDVWGNEKDGFEVNQAFTTSFKIELPKDATDKQILKALKDVGYLKKGLHLSSVEFDNHETAIYFTDARNQKPEGELRLIETKNRFRVLDCSNCYMVEDQETGNTRTMGDGVDMLTTATGKSVTVGTKHFIRLAEKSLNENPSETFKAYFNRKQGGDK
jgi:hypothetical protein